MLVDLAPVAIVDLVPSPMMPNVVPTGTDNKWNIEHFILMWDSRSVRVDVLQF